ncbi:MAG TPA: type II toxin-antitoxin system RelE/ParE family toxin [Verrucomicrobiae bacterium]|jgi:putative addiction module killer protein
MNFVHLERELRLYSTPDGKQPFTEWIEAIRDPKSKDIILARLARLRTGNFGDVKSVGGGVSELRIQFGPGFRVYFALDGLRVVILLCGGDKSTQRRDIAKAKAFWIHLKREK